MLKVTFRAMGCQMAALIDNETTQAAQLLQQVPTWFEEWEQSLSRFRPDSVLNHLNACAGQAVTVDTTLWAVLRASLDAERWTNGLVTPAVLPALEQAGYTRSFDDIVPVTGFPGLASAPFSANLFDPLNLAALSDLPVADVRRIRLNQRRRTVHLPAGMRLDVGGIAKGWAARTAAARLSVLGPALVDAGGDIAASGLMADGEPWPVSIADPTGEQEYLAMLSLRGGGVATSGIDYRRWLRGGKWQHHIIDPRTGRPAATDLLCASVLAADPLRAEAAAKAIMILGSRAGMVWLESHPELRGLLMLRDGRTLAGPGWQEVLWR